MLHTPPMPRSAGVRDGDLLVSTVPARSRFYAERAQRPRPGPSDVFDAVTHPFLLSR